MRHAVVKTERPKHLVVPVHEGDHMQGNPEAPLVLVEYADYECPYCGDADRVIKELQQELGEELCFVFRNFPLSEKHPHAERAAEAAEAADAQGRFWEMHDLIFENQDALEDEDLLQYAAEAHLQRSKWFNDVEDGRFSERILEDYRSGSQSGVRGTPTFFINGVRHHGDYDFESLLSALKRARRA